MIITGQIGNDQTVIAALARMLFDSRNMAEFGRRAGAEMVHSTQDNFIHQTAPDGSLWKPSLRAQAQGGQTLRDMGRLFDSLTYNLLPDGVEWGTKLAYAPYVHYGAVIKAKNVQFLRFKTAYGWVSKKEVFLPSRKFLGIKPGDHQSVANIIHDLLSEAV